MKKTKAFTLIELLVVISIIGVLATMIFSSINEARDKAKITKIVRDLRTMEQAFNMLNYLDTGCWPKERNSQDSTYCSYALTASTSNPTIAAAIASNTTNLSDYLSVAPTFPFPHDGNNYRYDNDLDVHNPESCPSSGNNGVNIFVSRGSHSFTDVFEKLNDIIDRDEIGADDNTRRRCGKLKLSTTSIHYNLSYTPY